MGIVHPPGQSMEASREERSSNLLPNCEAIMAICSICSLPPRTALKSMFSPKRPILTFFQNNKRLHIENISNLQPNYEYVHLWSTKRPFFLLFIFLLGDKGATFSSSKDPFISLFAFEPPSSHTHGRGNIGLYGQNDAWLTVGHFVCYASSSSSKRDIQPRFERQFASQRDGEKLF